MPYRVDFRYIFAPPGDTLLSQGGQGRAALLLASSLGGEGRIFLGPPDNPLLYCLETAMIRSQILLRCDLKDLLDQPLYSRNPPGFSATIWRIEAFDPDCTIKSFDMCSQTLAFRRVQLPATIAGNSQLILSENSRRVAISITCAQTTSMPYLFSNGPYNITGVPTAGNYSPVGPSRTVLLHIKDWGEMVCGEWWATGAVSPGDSVTMYEIYY